MTIPKQREFLDLTEDEIRQIVTDIFYPKKITCIKKSKKYNEITCKIYTEWETEDEPIICADEIGLTNPFNLSDASEAISANFTLYASDIQKLKSFCFAKGIYGANIDWLINNPYMEVQNDE